MKRNDVLTAALIAFTAGTAGLMGLQDDPPPAAIQPTPSIVFERLRIEARLLESEAGILRIALQNPTDQEIDLDCQLVWIFTPEGNRMSRVPSIPRQIEARPFRATVPALTTRSVDVPVPEGTGLSAHLRKDNESMVRLLTLPEPADLAEEEAE